METFRACLLTYRNDSFVWKACRMVDFAVRLYRADRSEGNKYSWEPSKETQGRLCMRSTQAFDDEGVEVSYFALTSIAKG